MSYVNEADGDRDGDQRTAVTVPQRFVEAADRFDRADAQSYGRRGPGPVRSLAGRAFPRPPDGGRAAVDYGTLGGIVADLATGFRQVADEGDRVALLADNRPEWAQVDLALQAAGLVVVTLPRDATPEETRTVLEEADVVGAVVDQADRVDELAPALDGGFAVVIDGTGHAVEENVTVSTLATVRGNGNDAFDPPVYERWVYDRNPAGTASIVYDRVTTEGTPDEDAALRGMEFTHAALASGIESVITGGTGQPEAPVSDEGALPRPEPYDTVFVTRCPTDPHVRVAAHLAPLTVGATVTYELPDATLVDDIREMEPDLVHATAPVCERTVETLRDRAEQGFGSGLVSWALERQTNGTGSDGGSVLDRVALRRLRQTFADVGPFVLAREVPEEVAGSLQQVGVSTRRYQPLPGTAMVLPEGATAGTGGSGAGYPSASLPGLECRWEPEGTGGGDELLVRGEAVFEGFPADPTATLGAFERGNWFRAGLRRHEDGTVTDPTAPGGSPVGTERNDQPDDTDPDEDGLGSVDGPDASADEGTWDEDDEDGDGGFTDDTSDDGDGGFVYDTSDDGESDAADGGDESGAQEETDEGDEKQAQGIEGTAD